MPWATIEATITAQPQAEWDELAAAASVYSSWQWLLMTEETTCREEGTRPGYITIRDERGLLGALPFYRVGSMTSALYDPVRLFSEVYARPEEREGWLPGLIGAAQSGYHGSLLLRPGLSETERGGVTAALVEWLGKQVDDGDCSATWLPYLPLEEAVQARSLLGAESLLLFTEVETELAVPWPDFAAYLGELPRNRRFSVRREIREFELGGPEVRRVRLAEVKDLIAPMYAKLLTRYGGGPSAEERAQRYLTRQAAYMTDSSVVWLCQRAGRATGFALFYQFAGTLYSRFVGFDYDHARDFEYFNLVYYEPLRYAMSAGIGRLHLGVESYESKLRRGAKPRPLYSVLYRGGGFSDETRRLAQAHNKIRIDAFVARNSAHTIGGLDVDDWYADA